MRKKDPSVRVVQTLKSKFIEAEKIDTLRTHIHECSLHTFLGLGQALQ